MLMPQESHAFQCPSCARAYTVRREIIPVSGAKIRCKRCDASFVVKPPEATRVSVWVLLGDPGVSREEVQSVLRAEAMLIEVRFLDEAGRKERLQCLLSEGCPPPSVVVFGDLHVLLADELLRLVTRTREVARVRVTTQDHAGLTEAAQEYCGFDFQIKLPSSAADVRSVVRSAVTHNQIQHWIA